MPATGDALLTDSVLVAAIGVVGTTITAAGVVVVALLSRDVNKRRKAVNETVVNFQAAWKERGELLDGMDADMRRLRESLGETKRRAEEAERREKDCQRRLTRVERRLDQLEAADG